jgi:hypothetical protein
VSVSRVTGPWRAAFPENSHQDHTGVHDVSALCTDCEVESIQLRIGRHHCAAAPPPAVRGVRLGCEQ